MKLQAFQSELPEVWMPLTLPIVQSLVPALPHDCLAVGATEQEQPIGLVIVQRAAGDDTAHVLSLGVAERFRRQGVGRHLLTAVGNLLKANGIRLLAVEYMAGDQEAGYIGRLLESAGFKSPTLGVAIWRGQLSLFQQMPWVHRMPLPARLHVESWSSLTAEQRARIQSGDGYWYPSLLSPLSDEATMDQERSLLLRYEDQVVGWMIVEPLDTHTIVFKSMFVQTTYRRKGRGIALMAESFRRFLQDTKFTDGMFCVEGDNADMLAFMQRYLSHPEIRTEGMWRTFRRL